MLAPETENLPECGSLGKNVIMGFGSERMRSPQCEQALVLPGWVGSVWIPEGEREEVLEDTQNSIHDQITEKKAKEIKWE